MRKCKVFKNVQSANILGMNHINRAIKVSRLEHAATSSVIRHLIRHFNA